MKVSPGKGKRWSRLDLRGNRVGVGQGRGGCLTRERERREAQAKSNGAPGGGVKLLKAVDSQKRRRCWWGLCLMMKDHCLWMHETSARAWCTGKTGWRGRWEGGSGWGTHVNPWLIHVDVWQKPLRYCKVISLQLIKINGEKKKTGISCHFLLQGIFPTKG